MSTTASEIEKLLKAKHGISFYSWDDALHDAVLEVARPEVEDNSFDHEFGTEERIDTRITLSAKSVEATWYSVGFPDYPLEDSGDPVHFHGWVLRMDALDPDWDSMSRADARAMQKLMETSEVYAECDIEAELETLSLQMINYTVENDALGEVEVTVYKHTAKWSIQATD